MLKVFKFIYITLAVILTAYLSSIFSRYGTQGWYQNLPKPVIVPPDFVFSVIWALLYALIIWASYLALTKEESLLHSMPNAFLMVIPYSRITMRPSTWASSPWCVEKYSSTILLTDVMTTRGFIFCLTSSSDTPKKLSKFSK